MSETLFKIRHKPSGKFLGGRSSFSLGAGRTFTSKVKAKGAFRDRAILPESTGEFELVEYKSTEVKTYSLRNVRKSRRY